jgi:hypothetical protein
MPRVPWEIDKFSWHTQYAGVHGQGAPEFRGSSGSFFLSTVLAVRRTCPSIARRKLSTSFERASRAPRLFGLYNTPGLLIMLPHPQGRAPFAHFFATGCGSDLESALSRVSKRAAKVFSVFAILVAQRISSRMNTTSQDRHGNID